MPYRLCRLSGQNGVRSKSFNGRFRDECLNDTLFSTLSEARSAITSWKEDHNHHRPHSALGNVPPAELAMKSTRERQAASGQERSDGIMNLAMLPENAADAT